MRSDLASVWDRAHFGFKGRWFRIGERVIHRTGHGAGQEPTYRLGTVEPSTPGEKPGKWVGERGCVLVRFEGADAPTPVHVGGTRSPLRRVREEARP